MSKAQALRERVKVIMAPIRNKPVYEWDVSRIDQAEHLLWCMSELLTVKRKTTKNKLGHWERIAVNTEVDRALIETQTAYKAYRSYYGMLYKEERSD